MLDASELENRKGKGEGRMNRLISHSTSMAIHSHSIYVFTAETRRPFSKACLQHSQTVIQPCMWFLFMMEQVRLCAVWPTENWLGSSMNYIQGLRTV